MEIAYVSICQHMSAYVSIRQRTYADLEVEYGDSIRQHTSVYVSIRQRTYADLQVEYGDSILLELLQLVLLARIRQHTSAYVSIRQHTYVLLELLQLVLLTRSSSGVSICSFVLVKQVKGVLCLHIRHLTLCLFVEERECFFLIFFPFSF
jgi:hypothetical protein